MVMIGKDNKLQGKKRNQIVKTKIHFLFQSISLKTSDEDEICLEVDREEGITE